MADALGSTRLIRVMPNTPAWLEHRRLFIAQPLERVKRTAYDWDSY